MPREIFDEDKFLEIAEFSVHCRVKRLKKVVKLKLRTKKILFTYICDPATAESLLKRISCDVIEL